MLAGVDAVTVVGAVAAAAAAATAAGVYVAARRRRPSAGQPATQGPVSAAPLSSAWFLCPYKRLAGEPIPTRYCAMDDFTAQIVADGGAWSETEILGNAALVKVKATDATLAAINAANGFLRIPNHVALADTLGDLTAGQRTAILNRLLSLGYSQSEIDAALPANWQNVTLGQVLRFAASRRLRPRYDAGTDTIVVDGPPQPVRPVADVDAMVP